MGRGRQKGQTKIVSKIKDNILNPYELWLEEDQIVLVDSIKEKPLSYHGDLEHAVKKVSYLSVVSQEKDYTLTGFIESYKNIVNQITEKFKI
jgi:hypothetical protein